MIGRSLKPLKDHSFFLFGARGVGKTTFLKSLFPDENSLLRFDLLQPKLMDDLRLDPDRFRRQVLDSSHASKIVLVDEVQRLPKLLDIVQELIVSHQRIFFLTGSSARRLKQAGVNLLAGRAFVYHLFPFSAEELDSSFELQRALEWGLLPDAYLAKTPEHGREYLRSYVLTYIEKEIQFEQWVRNIAPFRRFLEVAAQMSGKIINRSSIARDVGVDDMTIASYFEILEDTLLGFQLPGFHKSVRKSQRIAPKFYLFDGGVRRALDRSLETGLTPRTSAYGEAFEHFVIQEIMKRASYRRLEYRYSYLRTKDDVEIDLILDRPGRNRALIEIKSKERISESDVKSLETLGKDADPKADRYILSLDPSPQRFGGSSAFHWREGIERIFQESS